MFVFYFYCLFFYGILFLQEKKSSRMSTSCGFFKSWCLLKNPIYCFEKMFYLGILTQNSVPFLIYTNSIILKVPVSLYSNLNHSLWWPSDLRDMNQVKTHTWCEHLRNLVTELVILRRVRIFQIKSLFWAPSEFRGNKVIVWTFCCRKHFRVFSLPHCGNGFFPEYLGGCRLRCWSRE